MTSEPSFSPQAVLDAALREDFMTFAAKVVLELDRHPLTPRQHIELMASAMGMLDRSVTQRLIINIAPRLLKSRLCTVAYTAWLIGRSPGVRVLIASHDQTLADTLVNDVREVVRAAWYERAFPGGAEGAVLSRSGHFKCANGAEVMARSLDAGLTGHGFDLMVFDDPMDAGDAFNAAARAHVIDLFERKFSSRLQSQGQSKILIVAQRLHRDDLCGHLISQGGWTVLALPLLATESLRYSVGETIWNRNEGDVLDPDRYPPDWIEIKARVQPSLFAAQLQQQPFLTESQILKREWIRTYQDRPPLEAHRVTLSIDCAASRKTGSSYTCILAWASDGADHYLLEVVRDRLLFPSIVNRVVELVDRLSPRTVLIENASVGAALIPHLTQLLVAKRRQTTVTSITPSGSKADRLRAHVDVFANGHVLVPEGRGTTEAYIQELMLFEEGGFSDQVDATTQYLDYAREPLGLGFTPVLLNAGGSNRPPTPSYTRPIDRSTLRKPAHGVPSLRDPSAPRFPGGFRR